MDINKRFIENAERFLPFIKNPRFRGFVQSALEKAHEGDITDLTYAANLKRYPVDVEEFVCGETYMNASKHIYPAVMDELVEMNSGKYVEIVLTGGIGSAKTTCALYINAYQLYLLSCLKSPHLQYSLDPSSEILIIFQNKTEKLAKSVNYARFRSMIEGSEYFMKEFPFRRDLESKLLFPNRIEVLPVGGGAHAAIGQNVIGGIIDELNYMDVVEDSKKSLAGDGGVYDQAIEIYNSLSRRRKSRFISGGHQAGVLCLVSSRKYPGQFTDLKEEEAKTNDTIYVYDKRVWEVKPEGTYIGTMFWVFVGDNYTSPRILEEGEEDPENPKHMQVPTEFRYEFESNMIGALRDIAGVSTLTTNPYITDIKTITDATMHSLESILSRDSTEFTKEKIKLSASKFVNPEEPRWVHIDLSISGDATGVSCGYLREFTQLTRGDTMEILPCIDIDFLLDVRAPVGGEVKFFKIRELIYALKKLGLNIKWVSFDSFQSKDSMQLLYQKGYSTGQLSLDTSTTPYDFLKQGLYDRRVRMPKHTKAQLELASLEYNAKKAKVDHPPNGSKDIADALAGVVYGLSVQTELWMKHGINPSRVPERMLSSRVSSQKDLQEGKDNPE